MSGRNFDNVEIHPGEERGRCPITRGKVQVVVVKSGEAALCATVYFALGIHHHHIIVKTQETLATFNSSTYHQIMG
jgi:hypothetical protein